MAEKAESRTLVDSIPMRFVSFWRLIGDNFLPAAEWPSGPFEHPREANAELILDLRRFHLGTSMNEQLLDSTGGLLTTVFVTPFTRARQYAGNYVGARVKGSSSVAERGPA